MLLNAVVLNVNSYLRPPTNRSVVAAEAGAAPSAGLAGVVIGDGSEEVICTRASVEPNAFKIRSLTSSGFSIVVRMLNRVSLVSRPTLRLSTVASGNSWAFRRTKLARCDSLILPTCGSASLSRIVTRVPPVKSMLYIVLSTPKYDPRPPRAPNAARPSTISKNETRMQMWRGLMKSKCGFSSIFRIVSFFSQPCWKQNSKIARDTKTAVNRFQSIPMIIVSAKPFTSSVPTA